MTMIFNFDLRKDRKPIHRRVMKPFRVCVEATRPKGCAEWIIQSVTKKPDGRDITGLMSPSHLAMIHGMIEEIDWM